MENLLIIGLSILVFTGVIILLVGVINILERYLVPAGEVKILINESEEKSVTASPGSSLLSTLNSNRVYLPSACGGGGTCAMCKCQIYEGGGDILPTEIGFFKRAEIKENWRLACQVKVKNDMKIRVPDEVFSIQKFNCTVRSNKNVATFIKELVVDVEEGKKIDFRAGGYIQIHVPKYSINFRDFDIDKEYHEDWDKFELWNYKVKNDEEISRAYSMANYPAEGNIIMLNIRIATPPPGMNVPPGICSSYVFNLKPGDPIVISGPYGEFFAHDTDREMIYIGGGAGMAPLRSHIMDLLKTNDSKRRISYWYGARSLREMFYMEDFRELEEKYPNFSFHLALSEPLPADNWTGPKGFIHQVVHDNYLKDHPDPTEIEFYLCGPPMMMSAVNNMLYDLGVEKEMIEFDDFGG